MNKTFSKKKIFLSKKPIKVAFADDDYIVFEKPSGVLTIPGPNSDKPALTAIVNEQYAKNKDYSLHPCHRLDRETSGLIIYAKGKRRQQKMMAAFREKKVHKLYIAFVQGVLKKSHGELRKGIRNVTRDKFRASGSSKPALTRYKVIAKHKHFSVLEAEPVTGRTNQIRIHFAQFGHPVVGERKFSFAKDFQLKFKRVALHAANLKFEHPISEKNIELTTDLPKDMRQFLLDHQIKGVNSAGNKK